MAENGKTVALALGSGGARGYAHIGVLDALQERGYTVVGVSGCSMGAVVGGNGGSRRPRKIEAGGSNLQQEARGDPHIYRIYIRY